MSEENAAFVEAGIPLEDLVELRAEYFLPNKIIQNYITAFRKYDEDGSGDIDVGELGQLLHDLGIKLAVSSLYSP